MSTTPTAERTKCPLCVHVSTVYDGVGRCPAHGTFRATAPPPSAAVPDPADVEKVARAIRSVDYFADPRSWEADVEANRERYRRLAVAALTAVRPSPDSEAVAREAGLIAVRNMPFDWYCPSDERRPRVDCRECVAEVALDAALGTGDREGREPTYHRCQTDDCPCGEFR